MLACWASRPPPRTLGRDENRARRVRGFFREELAMHLVQLTGRWRVRPRLLALLTLGAVIASTWAVGASASPSGAVTFYLTQQDNFDPIAWQAQGAIVDAGTWDRGVITFSGGKSPGFAGMIQTFETNNAGTGSFRMNFQGLGTNDPF